MAERWEDIRLDDINRQLLCEVAALLGPNHKDMARITTLLDNDGYTYADANGEVYRIRRCRVLLGDKVENKVDSLN